MSYLPLIFSVQIRLCATVGGPDSSCGRPHQRALPMSSNGFGPRRGQTEESGEREAISGVKALEMGGSGCGDNVIWL